MVVAVVIVALAEVSAVLQLRVGFADRVADAPTTLTSTVTAADRARVVPVTRTTRRRRLHVSQMHVLHLSRFYRTQ